EERQRSAERGGSEPSEHPWVGRCHAVVARGRTHQPKVLREVVLLHTQSTTKPLATLSRANRLGTALQLSCCPAFRRAGWDKSRRVMSGDAVRGAAALTIHSPMPEGAARSW